MGYRNELQTENYGTLTKQALFLRDVLFLTCGTSEYVEICLYP